MRVHPRIVSVIAVALALSVTAFALAQNGSPAPPAAHEPRDATLRIEAPATLAVGAGRVDVVVRPPLGPVMPLLVTVRVEGEALQAVRARFLRADARLDRDKGELHFEVPVLARAPGIALLRTELSTYGCARSCQPVRVQAARQLQVIAAQP